MSLYGAQNSAVQASIINADTRVSNGAIQVIDRVLTTAVANDVTSLLSMSNTISGAPQFSQFVQILMNTGVFNDLNHPSRQFTLFIPTNNALARYQNVINSGDINQQRNVYILDYSYTIFTYILCVYLLNSSSSIDTCV